MTSTTRTASDLTMRLSTAADQPALIRLAQLDSARPLAATRVLIAEEHGEIVAARAQDRDDVIANPFRRTAATVALLEARAAELRLAPLADRRGRLRRAFRPGFATYA